MFSGLTRKRCRPGEPQRSVPWGSDRDIPARSPVQMVPTGKTVAVGTLEVRPRYSRTFSGPNGADRENLSGRYPGVRPRYSRTFSGQMVPKRKSWRSVPLGSDRGFPHKRIPIQQQEIYPLSCACHPANLECSHLNVKQLFYLPALAGFEITIFETSKFSQGRNHYHAKEKKYSVIRHRAFIGIICNCFTKMCAIRRRVKYNRYECLPWRSIMSIVPSKGI